MDLYQPIKIEKQGKVDNQYGVGILTPGGSYLTGPIPPMSNVYVTAYIPKNTIFKSKGLEHVLHVNPHNVVGEKNVPVKPIHKVSYFSIDPPRPSTVKMRLTSIVNGDFDIIIEELERSKFKIYIKTGQGIYVQPVNSWVWLG